jgi:hypothetical protein
LISQTGIGYRDSPLSRSTERLPDGGPQAGDRFPWLRLRLREGGPVEDLFQRLDDVRLHLLVFGQALPADALRFGDLLHVELIPADAANDAELNRAQIPRPSFYLLRPDGHVGLCGVRLDAAALSSYAAERLRLATVAS